MNISSYLNTKEVTDKESRLLVEFKGDSFDEIQLQEFARLWNGR
jgi:hypothetical protein